ncbi:uncharacterized protein DC041_0010846 [Schistosoma bovis]|uniref:Uncharacterized protein n=1 Tax=Schistosoma bovis TaxID=6184 RepID=A0A430QSJ2_SCHBO|nr:uncharacterized protein DC041_0010846 [Schistosoma bovis]
MMIHLQELRYNCVIVWSFLTRYQIPFWILFVVRNHQQPSLKPLSIFKVRFYRLLILFDF